MRYITIGAVRGQCPHHHRSIAAAHRCARLDLRHCVRQGGYSDRGVQRADGEPLDRDECDALDELVELDTYT